MDDRIYRLLEFDKIRELLAQQASSEMGAEVCRSVEPSIDYMDVLQLQDETREAEAVLFRIGRSPVEPFDNIGAHLKRAELDSVLSLKELLDVARFLRAVRSTLAQLEQDEELPILTALRDMLTEDRMLENDISLSIISEDEVGDNASPALSIIRRKKRAANSRIKDTLSDFVRSPSYSKYLQEALVTIRNDRYVLPVKSEYRSQIPGLVHDQSASGATIFIEPLSVVEANNEIRELSIQERLEIEKIMFEFTQRIKEMAEPLKIDLDAMTRLDVIFARAKLSREMRGVRPKINTDGIVDIKEARHPLINKKNVVPIDIRLGDGYCLLLITGPNTGGKTVTLKTAGLFSLMVQSGMHVPAVSVNMPIFENVFGDIGDAQSIEQSLSTFSSHMTNIARILSEVTPDSLVLFDELGAGTDPDEGAALAMSILDLLREQGIRTIATTHYSELKAYASTASGAENASVEFNVETLSPTYRLLIGVPGGSNAFAIASRLGLDSGIIDKAKSYLSRDRIKIDEILADAQRRRSQSVEQMDKAVQERMRTEELLREAEAKLRQAEQEKKRIIDKAREEARDIISEASEKANEAIDEIKQLVKKSSSQSLQRVRQINNRLEAEKPQTFDTRKSDTLSVVQGQQVHIISFDADGVALSSQEGKGEVLVSIGNMQVRVDISDIEVIKNKQSEPKAKSNIKLAKKDVKAEIDVRGQTLDEALMNVDLYLDNVFLSSLSEIVIIHGKGTGVLRDGIRKHLRGHSHVKEFRPGKYGEGEQGVTVVSLK